MSSFSYTARTPEGQLQQGVVQAGSREAAVQTLLRHGLLITELSEAAEGGGFRKEVKISFGVSKKDLMIFSRQMSIMLDAQVPLLDSLHSLTLQLQNPLLLRAVNKIAQDVDAGSRLSDALAQHPKIFSSFYASIVRSGEASGKIVEVFNYLADHIEREYLIVSKVRGAMLYPSLVVAVMMVVLFVIVFGIPGLAESPIDTIKGIYDEAGAQLPILTRIMVAIVFVIRKFWWAIILGTGVLGVVFYNSLRRGEAKAWLDVQLLKLPVFGTIFRSFYIARFSDNLATLIEAGIPIAEALEITSTVVGNRVYTKILTNAREGVRRGEPMHPAFENHWALPPMVSQMFSVGERTGRTADVLRRVAHFFTQETDRAVDNITTLIEPIIIISLGIVVALVVAGVLLPMYNLVTIV